MSIRHWLSWQQSASPFHLCSTVYICANYRSIAWMCEWVKLFAISSLYWSYFCILSFSMVHMSLCLCSAMFSFFTFLDPHLIACPALSLTLRYPSEIQRLFTYSSPPPRKTAFESVFCIFWNLKWTFMALAVCGSSGSSEWTKGSWWHVLVGTGLVKHISWH